MTEKNIVHIVGGGLAGSEAAWQLAQCGIFVVLHEMRPDTMTEAHKTGDLAELVCSNSFRSDDANQNCVGLLHQELRTLNSLIMTVADKERVPAGGALAVDREAFSQNIERMLQQHPFVQIQHEEVVSCDSTWPCVLVATGPLTSPAFVQTLLKQTGENALAFFDAIAPIVYRDTVDMSVAWFQSRYDKGDSEGDYINCPMTREQYEAFVDALLSGEKTTFKDWEQNTPYFSGCLPVEVMAERGRETLRWGPLKPVGLTNPHNLAVKPYAIVQLRCDNKLGTLYNMVGFQTKLKYGEQSRIFRMIPGMEKVEFARFGGIHRNTYLNSPKILDSYLRLKQNPSLRFAGQITGCEGYVESTAIGLLAALFMITDIMGLSCPLPPSTTALGALLNHITGGHIEAIDGATFSFQPMNVNFGLFPPLGETLKSLDGKRLRGSEKAKAKKQALTDRARRDFIPWFNQINELLNIRSRGTDETSAVV